MAILQRIKRFWSGTETRGVSLNDIDRWLDRLASGATIGPSWSNETITADTAQQLSVIYACISRIAETCATLPLHIYARRADGSREIVRNNYLYPLLHNQANPYSTAQQLRESLTRDALAWGNGVAWKQFDGSGRVQAMYRMRPDRVTIGWNDDAKTLGFQYRPERGAPIPFSPSEVFHLAGPTLDGLMGISVIQHFGYQSMGAAVATRKFGGKFFANGARASGVLSHPGKLTPAARDNLKDSFKEGTSGESKLGLVLLEEGLKFEQLSVNPDDAQFLETQDYQDHDLCRWFNMPPVLVGVVSKTTSWGTGIEQLNIGFLQYTMTPWLERWEATIQRDLIGARTGSLYAEHDVAGLLRGDLKTQAEYLRSMVDGGLMSFNEARAKLNLNPVPAGDMFARPLNTSFLKPDGTEVESLKPEPLPAPELPAQIPPPSEVDDESAS